MKLTTAALCAALQPLLDRHFGRARRIVTLARRTSPYQSSFGLEELDVVLEGGATLALVLKDLHRQNMRPAIRNVKPAFLYNPQREIEAYQTLLASAGLGTAMYYGIIETPVSAADLDAANAPSLLLLERVPGAPLYAYGELEVWREAARWLARLHGLSYRRPSLPAQATHLLRYNAAFYALWRQRARAHLEQRIARGDCTRAAIERLLADYARAADQLLALPVVWIHGEYYAANVLIHATGDARSSEPVRVCPVDWEMTAAGPALMDLAALIAGEWAEHERFSMIEAYSTVLTQVAGSPALPPWERLMSQLTCCRLHIAIQWLGWQEPAGCAWRPPPAQDRDWLAEALRMAADLRRIPIRP